MSIDSQLLPLLNHSLEEMETVHDILFAAKSCFATAIVERPTTSNAREKPKLYDGEKVLLNAIDRALLHSKQASDTLTTQRNKIISEVKSRERSRTNYLAALRKLASKKKCKMISKQKQTSLSSNKIKVDSHHVRDKSIVPSTPCYPPAARSFPASPKPVARPTSNAGKLKPTPHTIVRWKHLANQNNPRSQNSI